MSLDCTDTSGPPGWLGSLSSQHDVDRAISAEEAKIKQAQRTVIHLKAHRNTFATIFRLPPEVLGEVFVQLAQGWNQAYLRRIREVYHADRRLEGRHWIKITEVCRHWRSISLRTPRIWSLILLDHSYREGIELCLARSGQTPLDVVQVDSGALSHQLATHAVLNFHRTRSISFNLSEGLLRALSESCVSLDAHSLQELNIETSLGTYSPPTALLANASWPRLSSLTFPLSSLEFFHALVRPTLTTLVVRDPHNASIQPDVAFWVRTLRDFPLLQTLDLRRVIGLSEDVTHGTPAGVQATLPHLKRLSLTDRGTGAACACLLSYLVLPADTAVHLSGSRPGFIDAYFAFWATLAEKASGKGVIGRPQPPRLLRISYGKCCEEFNIPVVCKLYPGDVSLFPRTPHGHEMETYVNAAGCWTITLFGRPSDILIPCFTRLPLSEVHGIALDWIALTDGAIWRQFATLPRLRQFAMAGDPDTLRMLLDKLPDRHAFPALEWLELTAFTWNRRHSVRWKRRTRLGSLMLELIDALEARQAQGRRIKMLDLPSADNVFRRDGMPRDKLRLEALVDEFAYTAEDKVECDTCAEDDEDDELADFGVVQFTTDEENDEGVMIVEEDD